MPRRSWRGSRCCRRREHDRCDASAVVAAANRGGIMSGAEAQRCEVVRQAGPHIAGAALTYAWLALLFVTTRIQRSAPRRKRQRLLREQSTNIAQLQRKPLHVLLTSLLWLDGRRWPYVPVF